MRENKAGFGPAAGCHRLDQAAVGSPNANLALSGRCSGICNPNPILHIAIDVQDIAGGQGDGPADGLRIVGITLEFSVLAGRSHLSSPRFLDR
jgi:hypothetical protein